MVRGTSSLLFSLVIGLTICDVILSAQVPSSTTSEGLKRSKKQIYLPVENPEEHHGHAHHHHPDAHFPANADHHHHSNDQTDHHTHSHGPTAAVVESHTHTITPPKVIVKTEHVDTTHQRTVKTESLPSGPTRTIVHTSLNPLPSPAIHSHHDPHTGGSYRTHSVQSHKTLSSSPPGFPSSDYVRYYAKYTSSGGSPSEAAHSYYRDHNGHLYNYDVEPRFASPAAVARAHTSGTRQRSRGQLPVPYIPDPIADALHDADLPSSASALRSASDDSSSSSRSSKYHSFHADVLADKRNIVSASAVSHSRIETGVVDSPSGKGPHSGFYYGDEERGGRIIVGDRVLRF